MKRWKLCKRSRAVLSGSAKAGRARSAARGSPPALPGGAVSLPARRSLLATAHTATRQRVAHDGALGLVGLAGLHPQAGESSMDVVGELVGELHWGASGAGLGVSCCRNWAIALRSYFDVRLTCA